MNNLFCETARAFCDQSWAFYAGTPIVLSPGEQALLPATWAGFGKKPLTDIFFCATPPELDKEVAVVPGVCSAKDRGLMLYVENVSQGQWQERAATC